MKHSIAVRFGKPRFFYLLFLPILLLSACGSDETVDPVGPKACFEVASTNLTVDASILFDASCSENAKTYAWEFNDGKTSNKASFSRTFTTPGRYTLTLTVTDSLGKSVSDAKTFDIAPSPYIIHQGTISGTEVWEEGLHLVKNQVYIMGGSVTIAPGATIYMNPGASIFVGDTYGSAAASTFKAEGTADKPIRFLPVSGQNQPGEWGHLYFTGNTSPESALVHCDIAYGGKGSLYIFTDSDYRNHGIISLDDIQLKIENTTIRGGISHGISTFNGYSTWAGFSSFRNNTLTENEGHPISINMNAVYTIGENNRYPGEKPILVTGREFLQTVGSWSKQEVPYELATGLFLRGSSHLVLDPGVTVLLRKGGSIFQENQGRITAIGTATAPILFSSAEPVKAKGDWRSVKVAGGSSFAYCTFEYGGSGSSEAENGLLIVTYDGTTVNNCTFRESATDGWVSIWGDLRNSSFNSFTACDRYALTVNASRAHLVNGTHSFNNAKNIHISANAVELNEKGSWPNRNFPYYFSGTLRVSDNANGPGSLTIAPGTEIRFLPNSGLDIQGEFIADGSTSPIIFTLEETYRSNKADYWNGIFFTSRTTAASKMVNCQVAYAGKENNGFMTSAIVCSSTSNTPLLKNNAISHSAGHGIRISQASPVLSGNTFSNITGQNILQE